MIYIIKVTDEWGNEKGVYGATTSHIRLVKIIRKYMRALKIEFGSNRTTSDIPAMSISELNKEFQMCNTKGKECLDDYALYIEEWENGRCDDSYLK